jgi:hypothetical protein
VYGLVSIARLVLRFGALILLARLCLAQTQPSTSDSYKLEIIVTDETDGGACAERFASKGFDNSIANRLKPRWTPV